MRPSARRRQMRCSGERRPKPRRTPRRRNLAPSWIGPPAHRPRRGEPSARHLAGAGRRRDRGRRRRDRGGSPRRASRRSGGRLLPTPTGRGAPTSPHRGDRRRLDADRRRHRRARDDGRRRRRCAVRRGARPAPAERAAAGLDARSGRWTFRFGGDDRLAPAEAFANAALGGADAIEVVLARDGVALRTGVFGLVPYALGSGIAAAVDSFTQWPAWCLQAFAEGRGALAPFGAEPAERPARVACTRPGCAGGRRGPRRPGPRPQGAVGRGLDDRPHRAVTRLGGGRGLGRLAPVAARARPSWSRGPVAPPRLRRRPVPVPRGRRRARPLRGARLPDRPGVDRRGRRGVALADRSHRLPERLALVVPVRPGARGRDLLHPRDRRRRRGHPPPPHCRRLRTGRRRSFPACRCSIPRSCSTTVGGGCSAPTATARC